MCLLNGICVFSISLAYIHICSIYASKIAHIWTHTHTHTRTHTQTLLYVPNCGTCAVCVSSVNELTLGHWNIGSQSLRLKSVKVFDNLWAPHACFWAISGLFNYKPRTETGTTPSNQTCQQAGRLSLMLADHSQAIIHRPYVDDLLMVSTLHKCVFEPICGILW